MCFRENNLLQLSMGHLLVKLLEGPGLSRGDVQLETGFNLHTEIWASSAG